MLASMVKSPETRKILFWCHEAWPATLQRRNHEGVADRAGQTGSSCGFRPEMAFFHGSPSGTPAFPQSFPQVWKSWGRNRMGLLPVLRAQREPDFGTGNVAQSL